MYTLFNKRLNRQLEHPEYGVWTAPDIRQAHEMLQACREYLMASGLEDSFADFVIINVESNDEVIFCDI